jgi:hypothetical protein
LLGRRELHVQVEAFLERRNRSQDLIRLGTHGEVDVHGALAPADEDRCRAADEIDLCCDRRRTRELSEEDLDALAGGYLAHAAAR